MRIATRLIAAILTAATVACAGDSDNPTGTDDQEALKSPVGSFAMKTFNGANVPVQWDEFEVSKGIYIKTFWIGGKIDFRADSTFTIYYSHKMTGPGLPGNVQTDSYSGRWRLAPGGKIEVRPNSGGVGYWETTDFIYTVTIKSEVPGLDGKPEPVLFVFVR